MSRAGMRAAAIVLAILLDSHPVPARAQVDHRLDHRVRGADGRALDSNALLGSGGYNQARPNAFDSGLRARSIITGTITGLGRFHGDGPILNNNQFRAGLPSAGLSAFRGTSVGLDQILTGRSLRPTSYLGRQETIPDVGFIRRRLNQPGSSLLASPLTRPPAPDRRTDRSRLLTVPDPTDLRTDVHPLLRQIQTTRRQRPVAAGSLFERRFPTPFNQAAGSSIFGMPAPIELPRPPGPTLDSTRFPIRRGLLLSDRTPAAPRSNADTRLDDGTGAEEEAAAFGSPLPGLAGPRAVREPGTTIGRPGPTDSAARRTAHLTPQPRRTTTRLGRPTEGRTLASDRLAPALARPGEDRFADLLRAVRTAQRRGRRRLGFLAETPSPAIRIPRRPEAPRPGGAVSEEPATPGRPAGRAERSGRADSGIAELAATLKWADRLLQEPVRSFAGHHRDRLNAFLAAAEAALREGHYYEADRQYELALTVDPTNPLPMLGRGHALIAAGDYVSAALWLERGIRRFPQIAAFRLDLPALVGRHDVFDIRRADLESRLATAEHYRLRFLLGYLELYSDLPSKGLRNLARAAEQAPAGSMIALFHDLVVGKRELPPLDAAKERPAP